MVFTPNVCTLKVLSLSPKKMLCKSGGHNIELRIRKPKSLLALLLTTVQDHEHVPGMPLILNSLICETGYLPYQPHSIEVDTEGIKSFLYFGNHEIIYEYTVNINVAWKKITRNNLETIHFLLIMFLCVISQKLELKDLKRNFYSKRD